MKFQINVELSLFIVAAFTTVALLISAMTSSLARRDELFAKNIETAISKGVDPIAVKCAHDYAKTEICITYVMSRKTQ